jgi:hypothetical protein
MATRKPARATMAIAVLVAVIAAALWTAGSAEAIIVVGGKTGTFTLTSHQAVRVYVANTAEEAGIVIINSIFDSEGNLLQRSSAQRVPLGRTASFEYTPVIPDGTRMSVRVETTIDGATRRLGFIQTHELFDRDSGQTDLFVDYIIDDGK